MKDVGLGAKGPTFRVLMNGAIFKIVIHSGDCQVYGENENKDEQGNGFFGMFLEAGWVRREGHGSEHSIVIIKSGRASTIANGLEGVKGMNFVIWWSGDLVN